MAPVRQGLPGSSLDTIPGPLEMCQHMGGRAVLTPVGSWLWNWHGGQTLVWGYLLQQAWKFLSFQGLLFTQTCLGWVCPEMELGLGEGSRREMAGIPAPHSHITWSHSFTPPLHTPLTPPTPLSPNLPSFHCLRALEPDYSVWKSKVSLHLLSLNVASIVYL